MDYAPGMHACINGRPLRMDYAPGMHACINDGPPRMDYAPGMHACINDGPPRMDYAPVCMRVSMMDPHGGTMHQYACVYQ
jgi:hypothetical protein